MKHVVVIGAGFAGLTSAVLLAKDGFKVTLLEKNQQVGGRARLWHTDGYTFDMGPSWYLMPEVFERIFNLVGVNRADYYRITRLNPAYKVFFENPGAAQSIDIPGSRDELAGVFEEFEKDGAQSLEAFLNDAAYKYRVAMSEFLYRDFRSPREFFNRRLMTEGIKLHVFRRLDHYVRQYFQNHRARKILEYASVFLGSNPVITPALYSLMSHVDLNLGVWFPEGGMGRVALAFSRLAQEQGCRVITGAQVSGVGISNGKITEVQYIQQSGDEPEDSRERLRIKADFVLNTADYHWMEHSILQKPYRSYSSAYWKKKIVAPSMFLAYMGIGRKLPQLAHHNLYFADKWEKHFDTLFESPKWPENPCWYISRTTATSSAMAPPGKENIFLLVPVAAGLDDGDQQRETFFEMMLDHVKKTTSIDLSADLEFRSLYSHRDFRSDYNSFKGSALGLAHTLFQTAVFRPSRQSRKLSNLFHAGQYTHPGVGVPMVIISAELAVNAIKSAEGS